MTEYLSVIRPAPELVLAGYSGEELLALAARRLDAEERYGWAVIAAKAEAFWTEVESDRDTNAAFDRLVAERQPEVKSATGARWSHHDREGHAAGYGPAVLAAELEELGRAQVGERNNRLNLAAFKVGRLVGGGQLDAGHVIGELFRVARGLGDPPMTEAEIAATVRTGLAAGIREPRP